MNILVTGGAGFIGSHLCKALVELDHKVVCLDNFEEVYPKQIKKENLKSLREHPRFSLVMADVLDTDNLIDILSAKRVDVVYHLAGRSGASNSMKYPADFVKSNIQGTVSVLEAMKEADVTKLIYTSSSSVYGNIESDMLNEQMTPGVPKSVYASTKSASENLIRMYTQQYSFKSLIFRLFSVYGERQRPDSGMYSFVRAALKKQPLALYEKGEVKRDYTHVSDVVKGLCHALMYLTTMKESDLEVFNIGSGNGVTIKEIIKVIEQISHEKINTVEKRQPAYNISATVADISKAQKALEYKPNIDLNTRLIEFIDWMKREKLIS